MIGLGNAIQDLTKTLIEKRTKRAVARTRAEDSAKVQNVLDGIKAAPQGSEYRIELERYLERMQESHLKGEFFDEPLPSPDDY